MTCTPLSSWNDCARELRLRSLMLRANSSSKKCREAALALNRAAFALESIVSVEGDITVGMEGVRRRIRAALHEADQELDLMTAQERDKHDWGSYLADAVLGAFITRNAQSALIKAGVEPQTQSTGGTND